MNILCVFLSVLVIYIGATECNFTTPISAERASGYCYYCSNCPRPFYPSSPYVSQVYSSTGWCAMMSSTSSPDGIYTRAVAQTGLCYFNGCSWKLVSGVSTWVCCCNQNLCNAGVPTTTPKPTDLTCYYCSNCPRPFNPYSMDVSEVISGTGWCAKMSSMNSSDAIYTRGPAAPGLCYSNGCSWKMVNGVNTWVCCCNQYRCNTGVSTSKSTMVVFGAALMMIIMARMKF